MSIRTNFDSKTAGGKVTTSKQAVFAACVFHSSTARPCTLGVTVGSYLQQTFSGAATLTIVTDDENPLPVVPGLSDERINVVVVPGSPTLGQLYNAAKSWIAHKVVRDRRAYFLTHWGLGCYYLSDYLSYTTNSLETGEAGLVSHVTHVDLYSGEMFKKKHSKGSPYAVLYPPTLPAVFSPTSRNPLGVFLGDLLSPPRGVRKSVKWPAVKVVSSASHLAVQFYDGLICTDRETFMARPLGSMSTTEYETEQVVNVVARYSLRPIDF